MKTTTTARIELDTHKALHLYRLTHDLDTISDAIAELLDAHRPAIRASQSNDLTVIDTMTLLDLLEDHKPIKLYPLSAQVESDDELYRYSDYLTRIGASPAKRDVEGWLRWNG